jgi:hypothetical protein
MREKDCLFNIAHPNEQSLDVGKGKKVATLD